MKNSWLLYNILYRKAHKNTVSKKKINLIFMSISISNKIITYKKRIYILEFPQLFKQVDVLEIWIK